MLKSIHHFCLAGANDYEYSMRLAFASGAIIHDGEIGLSGVNGYGFCSYEPLPRLSHLLSDVAFEDGMN